MESDKNCREEILAGYHNGKMGAYVHGPPGNVLPAITPFPSYTAPTLPDMAIP